MFDRRAVIVVALLTGAALELGIQMASGRREAWDSSLYWTVGLPAACTLALAIGVMARARDWVWVCLMIPAQVTTMMVRNGELGGLWPLAMILASVLSAPLVAAAFIGSRLRRTSNVER
jgi:hypothetical protein